MFADKSFDLVVCINTIHNLPDAECRKAVREIQRVGVNAFITVDAYSNDEEYEAMMAWNITAETILSTEGWKKLFYEEGYTGDFYWFVP
jgi:2-polyprenyl-3-methyl-5-hydroxy-6-metoxy-1,4-benzoquinol methylase